MNVLTRMLMILPRKKEEAKTSAQLAAEYFNGGEALLPKEKDTPAKMKFIRAQITFMANKGWLSIDRRGGTPKERKSNPRIDGYYKSNHNFLAPFMDARVALGTIFAKQIMPHQLKLEKVFEFDTVYKAAYEACMDNEYLSLSNKIRLVPDGIARAEAKINQEIIPVFIEALKNNSTVQLVYHRRDSNQKVDDIQNHMQRTVLGLVAKEGAIYAVTCCGSEDAPTSIPLHRIEKAKNTYSDGYARRDFKIDDHIKSQHQFSHDIKDHPEPIEMVLMIHPHAVWHFKERPIIGIDGAVAIPEDPSGDEWRYTLKVKVPFTVQLAPFLWSHAGWVEVVSPPELRKYVGERVRAAAELYPDIAPKKEHWKDPAPGLN